MFTYFYEFIYVQDFPNKTNIKLEFKQLLKFINNSKLKLSKSKRYPDKLNFFKRKWLTLLIFIKFEDI